MKLAFLICALLASAVVGQTPSPKVWSTTWSSEFKEHIILNGRGSGDVTGKWYYDLSTRRFRIDRSNGNLDRYCGLTKYFQNTPCNQYVVDEWRYLHFPQLSYCCKCCGTQHGCGIVSPNWFSGGKYSPKDNFIDGVAVDSFDVEGLQENLYAQTSDKQIPKRIYQEPQSDMIFNQNTYSTNVDPNVFQLPSGCSDFCPGNSICTLVRDRATS